MAGRSGYLEIDVIQNLKALVAIGLLAIIGISAVFIVFWQPNIDKTPIPYATPSSTLPLPTQSTTLTPSITLLETPSPSTLPSATPTVSPTPTTAPTTEPTSPLFTPSISPILPRPSNMPTPIPLYPNEVRQYQGQNLSPVGAVFENAIAGIQQIEVTSYKLKIFGLVNKTVELSYNEIVTEYQSYQKVVTIYCVDGWDATILWEGILVKDLIQNTGIKSAANTIIFHASDGYTTALPIDYLIDNNILMAYKMNDIVIPPERGFPFQLVAESKYGYKWAKWITGIELSNDPNYLGYWESRGYPNNADLLK